MTLVRDDIPFTRLPSPYKNSTDFSTYCIATRLHPYGIKPVDVVNVYAPPARWSPGQGTQERPFNPDQLEVSHRTIVGGDFNAHCATWDPYQRECGMGRAMEEWSVANGLVLLNDGSHTRFNPATGGRSTPDVTFVSADIASGALWTVDANLGSDHLPILITIPSKSQPQRKGRGRFNYKKANWEGYEKTLTDLIGPWQEEAASLPVDTLNTRLTSAIMKAAKRNIPFGRGNRKREPFWNEDCEEAVQKRDALLADATAPNHTREDVERYLAQREETAKIIQEEMEDQVRQKIMGLGTDGDLWRVLEELDGRCPAAKPAATIKRPTVPGCLPPKRDAASDREKAECFCKSYARASRLQKDKQSDRPIIKEARAAVKNCTCEGTRSDMCSPFTQEELRAALACLSTGKSPGIDGVANELLLHLPKAAEEVLLLLFNKSWESGVVPAAWRKAEIVAIPKKGKPPDAPESYRPISLLCSASKLLERLVQARLSYWLESRHLLTPNQAGFRRGHSTTDQIARVTQSIFDSFEQPKPGRAVLALLDFQRAYDRVWRAALLAKLARLQVPAHVIAWIKGFLSDRRARVRWGAVSSNWKVFQEGLPQGSVLAPLLWLVYMNDIDQDIPADVQASLYADDVAILSTGRSLRGCAETLQPALDVIDTWTRKWKVLPSVNKCSATYFSLDPKETGGKVAPPPSHSPRGAAETRTEADLSRHHSRRTAHLHSTHRVAPLPHGQEAPMSPGAGGESVRLQEENPADRLHRLYPSHLRLWRRSLP